MDIAKNESVFQNNLLKDTTSNLDTTKDMSLSKENLFKNETFSWRGVTATLKSEDKQILSSSNGTSKFGKMLALMGPSGCGKSTLLNALAGLDVPGIKYTENIYINGRLLSSKIEIKNFVEYKCQFTPFYKHLTVYEALRMDCLFHYTSNQQAHERIAYLVEAFNLGSERNKLLSEVSSGTMERVNIIMTFLSSRPILLFDEPLSKLDSFACKIALEEMKKLADAGKCIILTVHQPTMEILEYLEDLYLISQFGIVFCGKFKDVPEYFKAYGYELGSNYGFKMMDIVSIESTSGGLSQKEAKRVSDLSNIYRINEDLLLPTSTNVYKAKNIPVNIIQLCFFCCIDFYRRAYIIFGSKIYLTGFLIFFILCNLWKLSLFLSGTLIDNFVGKSITGYSYIIQLSCQNWIPQSDIANYSKISLLISTKFPQQLRNSLFAFSFIIISIPIFGYSMVANLIKKMFTESQSSIKAIAVIYRSKKINLPTLLLLFCIICLPIKVLYYFLFDYQYVSFVNLYPNFQVVNLFFKLLISLFCSIPALLLYLGFISIIYEGTYFEAKLSWYSNVLFNFILIIMEYFFTFTFSSGEPGELIQKYYVLPILRLVKRVNVEFFNNTGIHGTLIFNGFFIIKGLWCFILLTIIISDYL